MYVYISVSMQSWYKNVVGDKCKSLCGWMLGMFVVGNVEKNLWMGRIRSMDGNAKLQ